MRYLLGISIVLVFFCCNTVKNNDVTKTVSLSLSTLAADSLFDSLLFDIDSKDQIVFDTSTNESLYVVVDFDIYGDSDQVDEVQSLVSLEAQEKNDSLYIGLSLPLSIDGPNVVYSNLVFNLRVPEFLINNKRPEFNIHTGSRIFKLKKK